MAVERRCPSCGHWNKDEDRCVKCGTPISPTLIEEIREEKREEIRRNTPPTRLDILVEKWKNSRFFLVKATYYILYSIAFTFMAIASFFAWLAASPNG
jgi:uncharacterized membrane protein YvbJ